MVVVLLVWHLIRNRCSLEICQINKEPPSTFVSRFLNSTSAPLSTTSRLPSSQFLEDTGFFLLLRVPP